MWEHLLRMSRNVIGGFYGYREPRRGGRQGDVGVVHDIAGDGGCVAEPDEDRPGNTEAVW